jgi:hypothetical protein
MSESSFAIRTVRNGQVKIGGKIYIPQRESSRDTAPLEGKRYAFGRYQRKRDDGTRYFANFVCLWGSEAEFHANPETVPADSFDESYCVNGYFIFDWWVTAQWLHEGRRE